MAKPRPRLNTLPLAGQRASVVMPPVFENTRRPDVSGPRARFAPKGEAISKSYNPVFKDRAAPRPRGSSREVPQVLHRVWILRGLTRPASLTAPPASGVRAGAKSSSANGEAHLRGLPRLCQRETENRFPVFARAAPCLTTGGARAAALVGPCETPATTGRLLANPAEVAKRIFDQRRERPRSLTRKARLCAARTMSAARAGTREAVSASCGRSPADAAHAAPRLSPFPSRRAGSSQPVPSRLATQSATGRGRITWATRPPRRKTSVASARPL